MVARGPAAPATAALAYRRRYAKRSLSATCLLPAAAVVTAFCSLVPRGSRCFRVFVGGGRPLMRVVCQTLLCTSYHYLFRIVSSSPL